MGTLGDRRDALGDGGMSVGVTRWVCASRGRNEEKRNGGCDGGEGPNREKQRFYHS